MNLGENQLILAINMALYKKIKVSPIGLIGIWRLEEDIPELLRQLPTEYILQAERLRHIRRKREWLATRVLLQQLNVTALIEYDRYGKPYLVGKQQQLSISHSPDFVAIILHPTKTVAIDIEKISDKVGRIKNKFLSVNELAIIPTYDMATYTLYWSAKETLFKAYSKGELDFRKHLQIENNLRNGVETKQVSGRLLAQIHKNTYQQKFAIHYQQIVDHILTYTITSI